MSNGWGGARPGAGRKAYPHLKHCRELLAQAVSDADWKKAFSYLLRIMQGVSDDPAALPIRPHESIEAGKPLMHYGFGFAEPEETKEEEIEPIRLIEIHHPSERGLDKCPSEGDPRFIYESGSDTPLDPSDPSMQNTLPNTRLRTRVPPPIPSPSLYPQSPSPRCFQPRPKIWRVPPQSARAPASSS